MEGDQLPMDSSGQVILKDPSGSLGTVDPSEVAASIHHGGFSLADPSEINGANQDAQSSSMGDTLKAFAEHAGAAGTFGLTTGIETGGGELNPMLKNTILGGGFAKPEDIQRRSENHPIASVLGDVAGFGATAALGVGEGAVAERAGLAAAESLGLPATEEALKAAPTIAKIGTAAVKNAAEAAVFQSGNEISKMFQEDPNQSLGTAAVDIGLGGILGGGVIGGAFGSISPLWKATVGPKLENLLGAISERMNLAGASEGAEKLGSKYAPINAEMQDAITKAGVNVDDNMVAGLSDGIDANQKFLDLAQSGTPEGQRIQESLKSFKQQAAESALGALGKSPEDVSQIEKMSKFEAGAKIKQALINDFKENLKGPVADFENIKTEYGGTKLAPQDKLILQEQLNSFSSTNGFNKLLGSPAEKFVNRLVESIPAQESLQDITRLRTNALAEVVANRDLLKLGFYRNLRNIFDTAENAVLDEATKGDASVFQRLRQARSGYAEFMSRADDLNARLKAGRYSNASSFIKALEGAKEEKFVDRLLGKNDAKWLDYVQKTHQEAANQIKDYYVNSLINNSTGGEKSGEAINAEKLLRNFSKLTSEAPEVGNFILTKSAQDRLGAVDTLLGKLNGLKWNYSNTASTLDRMQKHGLGTALGAVSAMTGHGPLASLGLTAIAHHVQRDIPDAIKGAMMRFLSSNKPIDAPGFKAMTDYISSMVRGDALMTKSAKALFKSGMAVLPPSIEASQKDTDKLDKKLQAYQKDPSGLMNLGSNLGHYAPDHSIAIGSLAARAMTLNQMRPQDKQLSPLNKPIQPSQREKDVFQKKLQIAQQPLSIMSSIKSGTLTKEDVATLKMIHPDAYQSLSNKVTEQMVNHLSKDGKISPELRAGLSTFLGHPLTAAQTPQGAQMIQATFQTAPTPKQAERTPHKMASSKLNKISGMDQTPLQRRAASGLGK